jgi:Mg2+ and Co2+ transporter CorA
MLRNSTDQAPNNVKIFLGDTNAKIRQEREYYTIIVKHILHKTSNENDNY